MSHQLLRALPLLGVAACASFDQPKPQPMDAAAMPVTFAYGSLARAPGEYSQITARGGETIKRMWLEGRREWAIVDVRSLAGDYVFTTTDPKRLTSFILKPDADVAWGESGTVREGSRPIVWRAFLIRSKPLGSCVALTQSLAEHIEAGPAYNSQELVMAIYCRVSNLPINPAEIPAIAAALKPRS